MTPPNIKAKRINLVPFTEKHLSENYVGWLNNPTVVKYSELRHITHSLETVTHYYRCMCNSHHYFWAIELNTPKSTHIGNITVVRDINNQLADVSILIGDLAFQSQGYGLESWRAACSYLLEYDGIRKVRAGTMAINIPMRRLMEKSDMIPDGIWRNHLLFEGNEVDVVFAALFRI